MGLRHWWILVLAGCLNAGEGKEGSAEEDAGDGRPAQHGPAGDEVAGGEDGGGDAVSEGEAEDPPDPGPGPDPDPDPVDGGDGGDDAGGEADDGGGDEGGQEGGDEGGQEGGDDGEFQPNNDQDGDGVLDDDDNCPFDLNPAQDNSDGPSLRCHSVEACVELTGCSYATWEGREYLHCPFPQRWTEAQARCRWVGADLAIPDTAEESDFLGGLGDQAWIGLSDRDEEGVFRSVDGAEAAYDDWAPRQPDDWRGREDCVEVRRNGDWNDAPCEGERAFTCEQRAPELADAGDACDICPDLWTPDGHGDADGDEDGIGDACDDDLDNDGVVNAADKCPHTPNPDQANADGGGFPCDEDTCRERTGCRLATNSGHAYLACDEELPWQAASEFCQALGGWLVAVDSRGENGFLDRLGLDDRWIGLNDIDQEGEYRWSNGQGTDYRNWNRGEPNNWEDSEDCIEMLRNERWNDLGCEESLPFICETDVAGPQDEGDACEP